MWDVYEHRRVAKQLDVLPLEVLKRYVKWKDIAIVSGPMGLRLIKGFPTKPCEGNGRDIVPRASAYSTA